MKKRLIGTLLLGALLVSSTSMFVSCKDYDDDINNIVATKADKTELEAVRQSLQDQIDGHKAQLAAIEGQIATLQSDKANKFTENGKTYDLVDVWTALNPLLQRVSVLESDLEKEVAAREALDALIGGNISNSQYFSDCKTYYEACEKLVAQIAALNTDLASAVGRVTELENALNTPTTGLKAVVADLQGQVEALNAYKARVEAIEADYLKEADKTEILGKIDALKTELTNKINTLESTLRTAIDNAKNDAINTAAQDATTKANNAKNEAISTAAQDATTKANNAKSEAIQAAKEYTDQEIEKLGVRVSSLETWQEEASKNIDRNFQLINNLNVYIDQALRGLVFNPDSYYQGVEATDLTVIYYRKYAMSATNAKTIESYGYKDATDFKTGVDYAASYADNAARLAVHENTTENQDGSVTAGTNVAKRYNYTKATRILEFQAKYYMNPSSAKLTTDNSVSVKAFDKPFHSSTKINAADNDVVKDNEFNGEEANGGDAEAGISVKDWTTKDGMLVVNYNCTNPEKLRQITANNAVTVFATQVKLVTNATTVGGRDTTITSDFAALYKQDVKDVRIAHAKAPSLTDVRNKHCGYCTVGAGTAADMNGLHLFRTVAEAAGPGEAQNKTTEDAKTYGPQDEIAYNDTIDLLSLVEVHYTTYDPNGNAETHKKMSAKHFETMGLHYEFTLTGLYYGSNETSESVHAAIKHVAATETTPEKWLIRPQMPKTNGDPLGWDEREEGKAVPGTQDRQTIGRTPIVRVELKDDAGNVLDYGYIRFKVVEQKINVPAPVYPVISYDVDSLKVSEQFCAALAGAGKSFDQTWIQMEYDVHNLLNFTQEEFEHNYDPDMENQATSEFKQFYLYNGKFYNANVNTTNQTKAYIKLGTVTFVENIENHETSIIKWSVSDGQVKDYIDKVKAALGANKTYAEAVAFAKDSLTRYVRYRKVHDDFNGNVVNRPDYIYVAFVPAGLGLNAKPSVTGTVNWDNAESKRNTELWFPVNGNKDPQTGLIPHGLDEIHANTVSPEDLQSTDYVADYAQKLLTYLPKSWTKGTNASSTALANKIVQPNDAGYNAFITVTGGKSGKDLTLDLSFTIDANKKTFKGVWENGAIRQFTTRVNPNNTKKLQAWLEKTTAGNTVGKLDADETAVDIAELVVLDGTNIQYKNKDYINHFTVRYINNATADALLNYAHHNQLADDVIKAVCQVTAKYYPTATTADADACDVPLSNNTFNVRFLRPINVYSNDAEVGDAYETGEQRIYLRDLVRFDDWRDVNFITNYWSYYKIKFIEILGVNGGSQKDGSDAISGENISKNSSVLTDMDFAEADKDDITKAVKLSDKSSLLDFVYAYKPTVAVNAYGDQADYGFLVYSNNTQVTRSFHVWLPIKVTYEWGDIYTTVKVTIRATRGNEGARQAK